MEENTIKLVKKIHYKGQIVLITGLHIGGTNTALNIGGPDKFVVRNPINGIPYIPGSSIKGKMRSLIELKDSDITYGKKNGATTYEPSKNPNGRSCKLFGTAGDIAGGHPSRLIIRDAPLDTNSADFSKTDLPYAESKTEVCIDRVTAKANPRTFERVPAGAKFNIDMVLNIFNTDDEQELKKTIIEALNLLEDDYLGGQGSRGYGQVRFIWDKGYGLDS